MRKRGRTLLMTGGKLGSRPAPFQLLQAAAQGTALGGRAGYPVVLEYRCASSLLQGRELQGRGLVVGGDAGVTVF
jgi:hypothetical protein